MKHLLLFIPIIHVYIIISYNKRTTYNYKVIMINIKLNIIGIYIKGQQIYDDIK